MIPQSDFEDGVLGTDADRDAFVVLGFVQKPLNKVLTMPSFTPSKIGGKPAWLCDGQRKPETKCKVCDAPLVFICQVYANLSHLEEFHRMLYLFACVQPDCLKS